MPKLPLRSGFVTGDGRRYIYFWLNVRFWPKADQLAISPDQTVQKDTHFPDRESQSAIGPPLCYFSLSGKPGYAGFVSARFAAKGLI